MQLFDKTKIRHAEIIFVAVILIATTWILFNNAVNWVTSLAVMLTFWHAQQTDAVHEMHKVLHKPAMGHYWQLDLFSAVKEAVWIIAFVLMKNYAAIIGRLIFGLYPFWRKYYRTRIVPLHIEYSTDTKSG